MTQLASDDFNRANGGLGANWTTTTGLGVPEIVSNESRASAAGIQGARYTATSAPNNQYAEITVGSVVSSVSDEGAGPACRIASGALTQYFAQTNTTETKLYVVVASSFTQLGSDGAPCTTGDVLRLTCSGTSISVQKNGATIIGPITDSSIASGDFGGWWTGAGGQGTANAWAGGDLSTPPVAGLSRGPGPGVSPDKRTTFSARALSQKIAGVDVAVSLTGQQMALSQGAVTTSGADSLQGALRVPGPGISPDYTKLFRARSLSGALASADVAVSLSGQSMALSQGSVVPQVSYALTGQVVTSQQGSVTPSVSTSLSGQAMTGAQGSVVPQVDVFVNGQSITSAQGTVTTQVSGDVAVSLSGQTLTFSQGSVSTSGGDAVSSTGAGRSRRRRRYLVEIDGQDFDVDSVEEAQALLAQAKQLAVQEVEKARASYIVRQGIKLPQIRTPNRELVPTIQQARAEIRDLYDDLRRDLEIKHLMAKADEDEEEAIIRLLM